MLLGNFIAAIWSHWLGHRKMSFYYPSPIIGQEDTLILVCFHGLKKAPVTIVGSIFLILAVQRASFSFILFFLKQT